MLDVVTIGDGMITFNPKSHGPMRFVHEFERKIGGAELNFAIGAARMGLQAGWISRLGDDEFGNYILNYMRGESIDVSEAKLVSGYPTSLNFKEIRDSGKGKTFYYREKSPTATMTIEDINEAYIKQAKILHISGVFPAISDNNIRLIEQAIKIAKRNGLFVSLDPNIRFKLWSEEKARRVLKSFLPSVDILLAGLEELEFLFETNQEEIILQELEAYNIAYKVIKKGAQGSKAIVNGEVYEVSGYSLPKVVDTVGAGDGYAAGFIYGFSQNWSTERILTYANAVGALVVTVSGDNEGLPYPDEVLTFMGEKTSVER